MNIENLTKDELVALVKQQQQDIKIIKTVVLDVTDSLGISKAGVFDDKMTLTQIVKPVIKELMAISRDAILPDFLKSKTENKLEKSLTSLSQLAPLLTKYQNL